MNTPQIVSGSDCLNYIGREIGYGFRKFTNWQTMRDGDGYCLHIYHSQSNLNGQIDLPTTLYKVSHNPTSRKIGLVLDTCQDGGLRVAILGNDNLHFTDVISFNLVYMGRNHYKLSPTPESITSVEKDVEAWNGYPTINQSATAPLANTANQGYCRDMWDDNIFYGFDTLIDYIPTWHKTNGATKFIRTCTINGVETSQWSSNFQLTTNQNTTLHVGEDMVFSGDLPIHLDSDYVGDPIYNISGKLYSFFVARGNQFYALTPKTFQADVELANYNVHSGSDYIKYNGVCIPYNLILTRSAQFATAYLNNGTIPPDAFLYPLDFDNLPRYDIDNTPDTGGDDDSGGDDDGGGDITPPDEGDPDDTYIIDENLPDVPSYTPSAMSNNNYYWLTAYQLSDFVRWFWNDVGNLDNFDDVISKVDGLYSDLASAILSFRYMPVEVSWIGGLTSDSNIIVGMIEKEGAVNCLSKNAPPIRNIGNYSIKRIHNNYLDYEPYTNISLYLPLHGFITLDTNLFMNHTINVKAVYDFISGTLLYMIYLDNSLLVNSVMVKVAIDIPITLQSKNDRDSAIFQNVSSTVSGLIGGAMSAASGNPLGVVYGASQVATQAVSPPLRVMGTMGEQPSLYAPNKCELIIKSPLECRANNYNSRVGYTSHRTEKMSSCSGLTIVHNPRINFTSHPLDSEVEQIYNYMQEGVIV